ncbi:MAG: TfoX/Sxy family protein [Nitrospinae bacterium]|nr:TfoX/Sxy family protein [Nitrospinota bacterium]
MAYNEQLAEKVRKALSHQKTVEEKKMMGGLTFMMNGKMCVGVHTDEIMCRIDPDIQNEALRHKGSRIMDFTGKPMRGFVFVKKESIKTAKDFNYWIQLALDFNKKAKASKKRP